jgi:hypothetical protein
MRKCTFWIQTEVERATAEIFVERGFWVGGWRAGGAAVVRVAGTTRRGSAEAAMLQGADLSAEQHLEARAAEGHEAVQGGGCVSSTTLTGAWVETAEEAGAYHGICLAGPPVAMPRSGASRAGGTPERRRDSNIAVRSGAARAVFCIGAPTAEVARQGDPRKRGGVGLPISRATAPPGRQQDPSFEARASATNCEYCLSSFSFCGIANTLMKQSMIH